MKRLGILLGLILLALFILAYPNAIESRALGSGAAEPLVFQEIHIRTGEASYYDDGPGLYGAVHSYRFGDARYVATVCRLDDPGRCVEVTVRDHMGNQTRAIDLSPDAFVQLAPLSEGVVDVTVRKTGAVPRATLPATDTQ